MNKFDSVWRFWQKLKQVDRHNIADADSSVQWAVLLILLLIVGTFAWIGLIAPSTNKLKAVRSQEQVLLQQFAEKYEAGKQYEAVREQLIKQNELLENELAKLPRSAPMTQIVAMINAKAEDAGVQIISAKVQAGSEQEYYTQRPIAVSAVGRYHALGRWLFALVESEHLLTVQNVSLQAQADNRLVFDAEFITYQASKKPVVPLTDKTDGGL
ncbi:type 4a pilus biogenesis protein PilO [Moraxella cuniculi]|uniref:Pilus assembly protein, PilO n=1 Tax=Moraxella cuniculi TaxID=34061 RepID=A0A448GVE8_9GAMM|nr:type 4a pilus biogenesis protein PilO [Moraxella cuniculi]VEG12783.1 Pilus assembly protein, PilO [Moraxella cuniculi]